MDLKKDTMTVGLVQATSSKVRQSNIEALKKMAQEAGQQGCDLLALPEMFGLIDRGISVDDPSIVAEASDPYLQAAKVAAREWKLWIHTGSTPVLSKCGKRMKNRSHLIDADGTIVGSYDKVHVCDIFPVGADPLLESARYEPGESLALIETPWGGFGMSICYDVRFPHLYREYALNGASLLFVPSAFTVPTGRAHWEILLRSRAIENGAFVVAPAQFGSHDDGRETWGHSIAVAPTGEILADRGDQNGLSVVQLELTQVQQARTAIPSLQNGRAFDLKRFPG